MALLFSDSLHVRTMMIRRTALLFTVIVLSIGAVGCDSKPVSTNKDLPSVSSEGKDKKGNATKSLSNEIPNPK